MNPRCVWHQFFNVFDSNELSISNKLTRNFTSQFEPIPEKEKKGDTKVSTPSNEVEGEGSPTGDEGLSKGGSKPSENHDDHDHEVPDKPTPVKSVMTKLKPSKHRYSFAAVSTEIYLFCHFPISHEF